MRGGEENPFASSSAPVDMPSADARFSKRQLLWVYLLPMLMSLGIAFNLLFNTLFSIEREPSMTVQGILFFFSPLAILSLLAMSIGWIPALAQLFVAAVRFSEGNPTWKHHLVAVLLVAMCYGIWMWTVNSGFAGIV